MKTNIKTDKLTLHFSTQKADKSYALTRVTFETVNGDRFLTTRKLQTVCVTVLADIAMMVLMDKRPGTAYASTPVLKAGDYSHLHSIKDALDPVLSLANSMRRRLGVLQEIFNTYGTTCYLSKLLKPCVERRGQSRMETYAEFYWNYQLIDKTNIRVTLDGVEVTDLKVVEHICDSQRKHLFTNNNFNKWSQHRQKLTSSRSRKSKLNRPAPRPQAALELAC